MTNPAARAWPMPPCRSTKGKASATQPSAAFEIRPLPAETGTKWSGRRFRSFLTLRRNSNPRRSHIGILGDQVGRPMSRSGQETTTVASVSKMPAASVEGCETALREGLAPAPNTPPGIIDLPILESNASILAARISASRMRMEVTSSSSSDRRRFRCNREACRHGARTRSATRWRRRRSDLRRQAKAVFPRTYSSR
jgi:hypothetical protein